jgi:MobA/MobL family protein
VANYHLSVHPNVSRGRGQSLVRTAAYNARAQLKDERTGRVWDYRRYGGVLFEGIYAAQAPDWARDLAQLVNEIERTEKRCDAQLAMNIDIALPHEQTLEQNRRLVQDFVREQFMRAGYVAHVVIHAPDPAGDQRNVHAHVLVTLRKIGPSGFARTKAEQQDRYRNRSEFVERLREKWEQLANRHLARNGIDARIDRRSLQQQGIARKPEPHRGPVATAMERRGQLAAVEAQPLQPHAEAVATRPASEPTAPIAEPVTPATIEPYQRDDTDRPPAAGTEAQPEPQPASRMIDEPVTVMPVVAELRSADEPPAPRAVSIIGTIKGLFRAAAKAITRENEPRPQPVKRRRGETEGEFRKLARNLSRHYHDMRADFRQRAAITSYFLAIPLEAYAAATAYLSDTHDQLSQLDNGIDSGEAEILDANTQCIFPQP